MWAALCGVAFLIAWGIFRALGVLWVVVDVEVERPVRVAVYPDYGHGFEEKNARKERVEPGASPLRLRLRGRDLHRLRFDPGEGGSESIEVRQLAVESGAGFALTPPLPTGGEPNDGILSVERRGVLRLVLDRDHTDPYIVLQFSPALTHPRPLWVRWVSAVAGGGCFLLAVVVARAGLRTPAGQRFAKRAFDLLEGGRAWVFLHARPVTMFAIVVIFFLRRPDAFLNPQFWMEDGKIFFAGAFEYGWSSLWTAWGGYHHLVPRMTAWLAHSFHPLYAPAIYNSVALAGTLFIAWRFFSPRFPFPWPALWALLLVLVPHSGEVFLNITNFQWVFSLALVQVLLAPRARNRIEFLGDVAVVFFAGMTGPFLLFLSPLFVWRFLWPIALRAWALLSVATAVGIVQFLNFVAALPELTGFSGRAVGFPERAEIVANRFLGQWLGLPTDLPRFAPAWMVEPLQSSIGWLFFLIFIPVVFVAGCRLFRGEARARWPLLFIVSALLTGPALYKFWDHLALLRIPYNGERYFYVPRILMMGAFLVLFSRWQRGPWVVGGILLLITLLNQSWFTYRYDDHDWPLWAERIHNREVRVIPINPGQNIFFMPSGFAPPDSSGHSQ